MSRSDWSRQTVPLHCSAIAALGTVPFSEVMWASSLTLWRTSLSPSEVEAFEAAHQELLRQTVPESFTVLHRLDAHLFAFKACD
jgi:hypothetical protein